jgi:hypothetical protein
MKVVMRGFIQWLDTSPASVRNHAILEEKIESVMEEEDEFGN